jgi:hypothetical protein
VVTVLRIGDDQRRARLARRHRLVPETRVDDPVRITRSLVALHASDPATVHLTVVARARTLRVAATEQALYDDRTLVRMLGMRRTMFVVPTDLVATVQASSSNDVAAAQRRQLVRAIAANGIADAEEWLRGLEAATLETLIAHGGAHTTELSELVPELGRTITVGSGRWTAEARMSSRVLLLLAADGHVLRGRPRGTWLSSQYRWVPTTQWLGHAVDELEPDAARADLARRWLARFGPATFDDLVWWTGWTRTRARRAVAALDVVEVELDDGAEGLVLAEDVDPVPAPPPWAALLPGLDPTPMGWKTRDWYLGPHRDAVFDGNGNVGPTVWWNGRIVGGWTQHPDGTIVHRLLTDIGADGRAAVEAEAARMQPHLPGTAVTSRFRSPLDRELRP